MEDNLRKLKDLLKISEDGLEGRREQKLLEVAETISEDGSEGRRERKLLEVAETISEEVRGVSLQDRVLISA